MGIRCLDEIGVQSEDYCFDTYEWDEQEMANGVSKMECMDLDISLLCYLYSRLCAFREYNDKDMSDVLVVYEGVAYSFSEYYDKLLGVFKDALLTVRDGDKHSGGETLYTLLGGIVYDETALKMGKALRMLAEIVGYLSY